MPVAIVPGPVAGPAVEPGGVEPVAATGVIGRLFRLRSFSRIAQ
jgi:hypothetical protein